VSRGPTCPACGSEELGPGPAAHPSPELFRTCVRCGLASAVCREDPGSEWYQQSGLYPEGELMHHLDWRERRFFEHLQPRAGGRLLDLGCGDGRFLAHARERGWRVQGLDASPVAARRAMDERGVQVQVHDLSGGALPAEAGSLEAVTAFELIEHLGDPLQLLRGARGLLQPGGKLVVTVPRLDRRPALFHPAVDSPPHHMTLWTESALRSVLRGAGFDQVEIHAPPLHPRELYLHSVWGRGGAGRPWSEVGHKVRAGLAAMLLVATGRAAGHSLWACAS